MPKYSVTEFEIMLQAILYRDDFGRSTDDRDLLFTSDSRNRANVPVPRVDYAKGRAGHRFCWIPPAPKPGEYHPRWVWLLQKPAASQPVNHSDQRIPRVLVHGHLVP